jgi:hypothetical protein
MRPRTFSIARHERVVHQPQKLQSQRGKARPAPTVTALAQSHRPPSAFKLICFLEVHVGLCWWDCSDRVRLAGGTGQTGRLRVLRGTGSAGNRSGTYRLHFFRLRALPHSPALSMPRINVAYGYGMTSIFCVCCGYLSIIPLCPRLRAGANEPDPKWSMPAAAPHDYDRVTRT